MKFSQTKRETDEPRNYHPGPGHYEVVEYPDIFEQIALKKASTAKTQGSSWGYGDRFNYKTLKNTTTTVGPGEYVGIHEWVKPKKQKTTSTFDAEPRKILTIPSIPSQSQNLGYQQTSDGLLVMIQDPKNPQGVIGPGSYEISKEPHKPKTKTYSFSKLGHDPSQKQGTDKRAMEFGPETYNVTQIKNPFQESPTKDAEFETSPKKQARRKPQFPAASKREFNLEAEKFEYPGPGHYYNEQVFSCFKARSISPHHQPFNTKESRFAHLLKGKEIPGPGDYQSEKAYNFLVSKSPAHVFTGPERSTKLDEQNSPGPGSYEVKSIFKENNEDENFIKQLLVDKPPAFGSSTKRFVKKAETILETPGPGYYELKAKAKKKSKKIIRLINPSVLPTEIEEEAEKFHAGAGFTNLVADAPKGHRPYYEGETPGYKRNGGAGSCFKSQTKRFLSTAGVSSLGPGSYQIPPENFKLGSFNQQKDIISKSPRDPSLNSNKVTLGPGHYNPKVDLIYPHKFSLKMTPEVKFEPKYSLVGY